MNEDRFWLLVSLKLAGEAKPEELAELEHLLQQYPQLGLRAEMMNAIMKPKPATLPSKSNSTGNTEASFNKHMQRLSSHFAEPVLQYEDAEMTELDSRTKKLVPFTRKRLLWITGIAASILIAWFMVFNIPGKNSHTKKATAKNTVSTKRGSKSKIQLPDGTQVWLNADSKITYNENFQGTLREVQLTGEAFFDVTRDETRPFVIHTNAIDVRVLGTAFNVRSYADEKNTETSLIHGSVEITLRNNPDKKIILKPNEKLTVQNNEPALTSNRPADKKTEFKQPLLMIGKLNYKQQDSSAIETLWVKNKLAFDGEALEDIALKIERWFDVKVTISDEKLKKEPFSGVFDNESLQVVMEALRLTGKFKYDINKKEVTIGH
jgi:ferric-dicitrate binding protein FerR (iron transport regulator)